MYIGYCSPPIKVIHFNITIRLMWCLSSHHNQYKSTLNQALSDHYFFTKSYCLLNVFERNVVKQRKCVLFIIMFFYLFLFLFCSVRVSYRATHYCIVVVGAFIVAVINSLVFYLKYISVHHVLQ